MAVQKSNILSDIAVLLRLITLPVTRGVAESYHKGDPTNVLTEMSWYKQPKGQFPDTNIKN